MHTHRRTSLRVYGDICFEIGPERADENLLESTINAGTLCILLRSTLTMNYQICIISLTSDLKFIQVRSLLL